MKLKSKLIATIVSICAAIAVMGVGVWAATGSFTVTVKNTVNLSFQNLTGTVTATAKAGADVTGVDAEGTEKTIADLLDASAPVVLYDSSVTDPGPVKFNGIGASATVDDEGDVLYGKTVKAWDGADFFTTYNAEDKTGYITDETTAATVMYEFTFAPLDADAEGAGAIGVKVTEDSKITNAKGAIIEAKYYVNNSQDDDWYELESGNQAIAGAINDTIKVRCIMTYSNENKVSASADGTWVFSVEFAAVGDAWTDAITGHKDEVAAVQLGDDIVDGVLEAPAAQD